MKRLVVIGAGGNIGSHLVSHLARMPAVGEVVLVDGDRYEAANLWTQNIERRDAGRLKVHVQRDRLRAINPKVRVDAVAKWVEQLPPGLAAADVVLACLDSRRSRQYVNEMAWRMGTPWIDAGIEPGGMLARVNVYVPDAQAACLECAWDERDYARLEQSYPCTGREEVASTAAASFLGAAAAALQASECAKALTNDPTLAAGRQVVLDLRHHREFVMSLRQRETCRMSHEVWGRAALSNCDLASPLADVARFARGIAPDLRLEVYRKRLVRGARCSACGREVSDWRFVANRTADMQCPACGGRMRFGFHAIDLLTPTEVISMGSRTLEKLGLQAGDVLLLRAGARSRRLLVCDSRDRSGARRRAPRQ
ncbi:MAG: ThiF family adenylyltransferase [Acidobacteria bacterium]|nr:ThiF family adenylyltransferase [Acidobacteriota bacterium]